MQNPKEKNDMHNPQSLWQLYEPFLDSFRTPSYIEKFSYLSKLDFPHFLSRLEGHEEIADRLVECQYELTDRLAYYLCGKKPGIAGKLPSSSDPYISFRPPESYTHSHAYILTNSACWVIFHAFAVLW